MVYSRDLPLTRTASRETGKHFPASFANASRCEWFGRIRAVVDDMEKRGGGGVNVGHATDSFIL